MSIWHLGDPRAPLPAHAGVIPLTASAMQSARERHEVVVPFHRAADAELEPATEVYVEVPEYRGNRFLELLGWFAASRLMQPGAVATWHVSNRRLVKPTQRVLEQIGWELSRERAALGGHVLVGARPVPPTEPEAAHFTASTGSNTVELAADYGVFSPKRIDDGTQLLIDVALAHEPVDVVADIGVGYGAIAVVLTATHVARRALGTDVDSVALWLAERNARTNGIELDTACDADPCSVPPTPLTCCNIPTHLDAAATRPFVAGLAERARDASLLVVVHQSLEARYAQHFADHRCTNSTRVAHAEHVVLGYTRASAQ